MEVFAGLLDVQVVTYPTVTAGVEEDLQTLREPEINALLFDGVVRTGWDGPAEAVMRSGSFGDGLLAGAAECDVVGSDAGHDGSAGVAGLWW